MRPAATPGAATLSSSGWRFGIWDAKKRPDRGWETAKLRFSMDGAGYMPAFTGGMMKLGRFARAAILLIAPIASAMAAAQGGGQPPTGNLNIPSNVQFVGQTESGVRKATAIVNGDVITGSDVDQRTNLVIVTNQIQLPAAEMERFRAQVLRNLIDESLQIQAAQQQDMAVTDQEVEQYYQRFAANQRQTPQGFAA